MRNGTSATLERDVGLQLERGSAIRAATAVAAQRERDPCDRFEPATASARATSGGGHEDQARPRVGRSPITSIQTPHELPAAILARSCP